jgi:phage/plasmid-like protein (TIGR03299 family)
MAHNIGEMFYYGSVPWHGLGNRLDQPATWEQALYHGGLDWEVELMPLTTADDPAVIIPHRMAVVRKDRKKGVHGRVIGVVHPNFKPLQNRDAAKLFDDLLGQGKAIYHTGGYLKNGEVVWLLARIPDNTLRVADNDPLETYLLFSNSHDGSLAIDIRLTTIRVVCNNTLTMALQANQSLNKVFRRGHNNSPDLLKAEAQNFFQFVTQEANNAEKLFKQMSVTECADQAFKDFLAKLLPLPAKPATAKNNNSVNQAYETHVARIKQCQSEIQGVRDKGLQQSRLIPARGASADIFGNGAQEQASFTPVPADNPYWWGALNAVTGWVDNCQETKGDRFAHLRFGAGHSLKANALALVEAEMAVQTTQTGGAITPVRAERPLGYGEKNQIFTQEAADKACETLRKKLAMQPPLKPGQD